MTYLCNKENLDFTDSADRLNTKKYFQYDIFNIYQGFMLITNSPFSVSNIRPKSCLPWSNSSFIGYLLFSIYNILFKTINMPTNHNFCLLIFTFSTTSVRKYWYVISPHATSCRGIMFFDMSFSQSISQLVLLLTAACNFLKL